MLRENLAKTLLLLCLFYGVSSAHAGTRLCVLLSSKAASYQQVKKALVSEFQASAEFDYELTSVMLDRHSDTVQTHCHSPELVIAVGTAATRHMLSLHPEIPLVSTFVAKATLRGLKRHYPGSELVAAIYPDQPAPRLLGLVKALGPNIEHLGSLLGSLSAERGEALREAAQSENIVFNAGVLKPDANPVKQLERIMETSDAYLVLPDKAQVNRRMAKWIIYLSFKYRLPVIGYSQKYVDAGALIALFSTPWQTGKQTVELVNSYLKDDFRDDRLFQYPRYFSIAVNDKVRRALKLNPINKKQIMSRLQAAEQNNPKPTINPDDNRQSAKP